MTNNLPDFYSMIAIVVIAVFAPIISLVARKYVSEKSKTKLLKAMSVILFLLEAIRFFYNAHFFEGAITPAKELRFGFITFMTILVLFATFINNKKAGDILKRSFVLLSLVSFFIGLLGDRCYASTAFNDEYAVLKGLFFIEVGMIISIALMYCLDNDIKITIIDTLIAVAFCLVSVGVAVFYNFIWKLEIEYNSLWFIQKGVYSVSPFIVYFISLIFKRKKD